MRKTTTRIYEGAYPEAAELDAEGDVEIEHEKLKSETTPKKSENEAWLTWENER